MFPRSLLSAAALTAMLISAPALAAGEDGDPSVKRRLDERGIRYKLDSDGDFKVTYNYSKEGRTQLVYISGRTETVGGVAIREVFAPAAKVDEDGVGGEKALDLLRRSRKAKLGAWEIGGAYLYYVVKLPDHVSARELEAAMDVAAEIADDLELELSGARDEF